MQNKTEILTPENTYHIYNRANGSEKLFLSNENYNYFLRKYQEYVRPVADTFCYCLMPNHFHFLIRIKNEEELLGFFNGERARKNLQGFKNLEGLRSANISELLSNQFSNFFNAYSKAFNKMHQRKGNLFMHTFKRKKVNEEAYLKQLVQYIHFNPVEASLCDFPENWSYSSYPILISNESTFLNRDEIIGWFENTTNFTRFHSNTQEIIPHHNFQ